MVCTWLTESEFERYSSCDDKDVNNVLQEVRKINPIWFIDERIHTIKPLFRKAIIEQQFTLYQIYDVNGISSKPEVRIQMSAGRKDTLLNFLYGLNVGYHFNKQTA